MTFPITNLLEPKEFGARWQRARTAALGRYERVLAAEEETHKLAAVPPENRSALLRAVFENSRKLGASARWYFGAAWEAADFYEVISGLESPCFSGHWTAINEGMVLERPGCEAGRYCGSFACDYFKEAMDGLVHGLAPDITFCRHQSFARGSQNCKDLFINSSAKHLIFEPLAGDLHDVLCKAQAELAGAEIALEFLGQAEGEIFYKWQVKAKESCRDFSSSVRDTILKYLNDAGLTANIRDVTPRAVLGPGAAGGSAAQTDSGPVNISRGARKKWNYIINSGTSHGANL